MCESIYRPNKPWASGSLLLLFAYNPFFQAQLLQLPSTLSISAMADDDSTTPADTQEGENEPNPENPPPPPPSDDDDNTDSDYESGDSDLEEVFYTRPGEEPDPRAYDNEPETNIKRFTRILESRRMKKMQEEEEKDYVFYEDLFNFPEDPENWREEDLKELWADAPLEMTKPGWDPVWADTEEWETVKEEIKAGRDPPIAPFYVPYRKPYPAIPDNHYDISSPKSVIEELDRIEEFLNWVSYIFPDGSSYVFIVCLHNCCYIALNLV